MQFSQWLKTWRVFGANLLAEWVGGVMQNGPTFEPLTTLVYGPATIIPNMALGNLFVVTVTDAVAFAIGAPINPPPTGKSALLYITIRNASGGATGAGTWNAVYKVTGAVPAIATGFSRTFTFRWDGTNWVQLEVPATDVPN